MVNYLSDRMTDIDMILSMVNNPTRRRILEALAREPGYPLQLSKEIGVSQQAIMKNLDLLEKNGMVISRQVTSTMGPMRTVYTPVSKFTLVIDMHSCRFAANIIEEKSNSDNTPINPGENIENVRKKLAEIDREVKELDRKRSELIEERQRIISSAMYEIENGGNPEMRQLMYTLLSNPEIPSETITAEYLTKNENKNMKNRKSTKTEEAL